MVTRLVVFTLLIFALMTSVVKAADCYGPQEKELAKKLLLQHPDLSAKLDSDKNGVWFVRRIFCELNTKPTVGDEDFLKLFFAQEGWKALMTASRKHHLSHERVLIAMDDTHQPSIHAKGDRRESHSANNFAHAAKNEV